MTGVVDFEQVVLAIDHHVILEVTEVYVIGRLDGLHGNVMPGTIDQMVMAAIEDPVVLLGIPRGRSP